MYDEDFEEYKKLLKRVSDNFFKIQHCYTTAIQFKKKNIAQAIKLIEYGIENFLDDVFSVYISYLYIGNLYEDNRGYQKAYDAYLNTMNAKYVNAMPINRMAEEFKRNDVHISRHVMSNCTIKCAEKYLKVFLANGEVPMDNNATYPNIKISGRTGYQKFLHWEKELVFC